jgi:hypothetical protein
LLIAILLHITNHKPLDAEKVPEHGRVHVRRASTMQKPPPIRATINGIQ